MHHASAPAVSASRARLIERLLERQGPGCCYCDTWLLIPQNVEWRGDFQEPDPRRSRGFARPYLRVVREVRVLHLEHAIPKARGGGDDIDNLRLSCAPCNLAKGTLTEVEFLAAIMDRVTA